MKVLGENLLLHNQITIILVLHGIGSPFHEEHHEELEVMKEEITCVFQAKWNPLTTMVTC